MFQVLADPVIQSLAVGSLVRDEEPGCSITNLPENAVQSLDGELLFGHQTVKENLLVGITLAKVKSSGAQTPDEVEKRSGSQPGVGRGIVNVEEGLAPLVHQLDVICVAEDQQKQGDTSTPPRRDVEKRVTKLVDRIDFGFRDPEITKRLALRSLSVDRS